MKSFVTDDGEQLHLSVRGDGPPLVLLHGNFGSWMHWIRNVEVLSQHYRVIALDIPGFGDSATPPKPCPSTWYSFTPRYSATAATTSALASIEWLGTLPGDSAKPGRNGSMTVT